MADNGAGNGTGDGTDSRSTGAGRRVVVGIDGSAPSRAALRWAVGQAALTGATVHAVAAWEPPSLHGWLVPLPDDDFERTAMRTLTAEVDEVVGRDRPVPVEEILLLGHPAEVLLELAEGADLLVLGSRGRGTFARTLLGSVSTRCAAHASCPVVIVRADGVTAAPARPLAAAAGADEPAVRTTKDWQLSLHLVEERDSTRVHAVLDAGGTVLHSDAYARRNPLDDPAPAVGDEFAVGRALIDLGHQLLRAGTRHATGPAEE